MVSAVGVSPVVSAVSNTSASSSGLEAEVARYKKELADCVSCETADTKQGQADIQELTNKINIVEARLKESATNNPVNQPDKLSQSEDTVSALKLNAVTDADGSQSIEGPVPESDSSDSGPGKYVDVFI